MEGDIDGSVQVQGVRGVSGGVGIGSIEASANGDYLLGGGCMGVIRGGARVGRCSQVFSLQARCAHCMRGC